MADPPRKRVPPPVPKRAPSPPSSRVEPRTGPPSRKHPGQIPRKMTMEVDMAWLIPSMPPPATQKSAATAPPSRRPQPMRTMEVQMDWLEDARVASRRRGPPPLPEEPAALPKKGPPPLPTAVAKPRRALPPPLPREEPADPPRRSVRPRKP